MEKYVDSKVWLTVTGGVVGWDVSDLNARIDEFNSLPWNQISLIGCRGLKTTDMIIMVLVSLGIVNCWLKFIG